MNWRRSTRRVARRSPRRTGFAILLAVGIALLGLPAAGQATSAQDGPAAVRVDQDSRPNILVMVTDDQRLEGTMQMLPAVVDWFADEGVTYTNGVVTTPECCPSRASIFTGQYVHNHGVLGNQFARHIRQHETVQHELQRSGYQTAISGKFLNNWNLCTDDPLFFDRFAIMVNGYEDAAFRVDHYTGESYDFETSRPVDGIGDGTCGDTGDGHGVKAAYSTTYVQDKALEFMNDFEEADGDPWFLYVAPFAPHGPATPEEKYESASVPAWDKSPAVDEADVSDKPPHIRDTRPRGQYTTSTAIAGFRERQLRSLMSVDDMVLKLRETLSALGEQDNTIVVFLSDNGAFWAEHRLQGKSEPYPSATAVPFYASWPACDGAGHDRPGCPRTLPPGGTDHRIAANIDIAPTIYQAAGITPSYIEDGRSLFSVETRDRILMEYWLSHGPFEVGIPTWAAFQAPGRYLYRENFYEPDSEHANEPGHDEFYDLAADPFHLSNALKLGTPNPSLRDLSAQLKAARECRGASCRALMEGSGVQFQPGQGRIVIDAPDLLRVGSPGTVVTTFTNDGKAPVQQVRLALDAPSTTVRPVTPKDFDSVGEGETVSTRWEVTVHDSAGEDGHPLTTTAGYQARGGGQTSWDVARIPVQ